jgi:hypothetical protein
MYEGNTPYMYYCMAMGGILNGFRVSLLHGRFTQYTGDTPQKVYHRASWKPTTHPQLYIPQGHHMNFCHSPTQPQLKLGVTKYLVGPPTTPPHPTTPPRETLKALLDKIGGWFSVYNLIFTQLERQPLKKMEDDLKQMKKMDDYLKKN